MVEHRHIWTRMPAFDKNGTDVNRCECGAWGYAQWLRGRGRAFKLYSETTRAKLESLLRDGEPRRPAGEAPSPNVDSPFDVSLRDRGED